MYHICVDEYDRIKFGEPYLVWDSASGELSTIPVVEFSAFGNLTPSRHGTGYVVKHPLTVSSGIAKWETADIKIAVDGNCFKVYYEGYVTDCYFDVAEDNFIVESFTVKSDGAELTGSGLAGTLEASGNLKYNNWFTVFNTYPVCASVKKGDILYKLRISPFGYSSVYNTYVVMCMYDYGLRGMEYVPLYFNRGRVIGCFSSMMSGNFSEPSQECLADMARGCLLGGKNLFGVISWVE